MGLELNTAKSEIVTRDIDPTARASVIRVLPDVVFGDPADATLLGSPIGEDSSIDDAIAS